MAFTWTTQPDLPPPRAAELGTTQEFTSQEEAEAWFSEAWPELDEAGIESVTLLEDGTTVYGPMPLSPA